ncbi:polysaccharide pyruvyl transferase family protein [Vibrio breoganii]
MDNSNISGDLYSKKKVFVVLAADYGNLGDVAITYAQSEYLRKNLPGYEVVDVPISKNLANIRHVKKIIGKDDILTIVGGGNMTDIYQSIEDCRLEWVKSFPKHRIICFPQTIDFTDTKGGAKSFNKSKKVYESHENITMFAREKISYEIMKRKLNVDVKLCPDIVLSLDKLYCDSPREGILSCIREDGESVLGPFRNTLLRSMEENFSGEITFSDTHIGNINLSLSERTKALDDIWRMFSKSEVVVTDRLHGMIFSVITKTPCVVLENSNHKIIQTYKNWLSNLDYIQLVEPNSVSEVINKIQELRRIEEYPDQPQGHSYNHDNLKLVFQDYKTY